MCPTSFKACVCCALANLTNLLHPVSVFQFYIILSPVLLHLHIKDIFFFLLLILFPLFLSQSTLPDDVFENGGCGVAECKRLSFTFSDTPASSPAPSHSHPEITVTPPESDQPPQLPPLDDLPGEEEDGEEEEESTSVSASLASASEAESEREWERVECQHGYESTAHSLSSEGQISAVGPEDVVFLESGSHDESSELKPVELDGEEGSLTRQLVRRLTSSDILPEPAALSWAGESSLEEAIHSLLMKLESMAQRCRELQDLEQEVMKLEDLLKVGVAFSLKKYLAAIFVLLYSPGSL